MKKYLYLCGKFKTYCMKKFIKPIFTVVIFLVMQLVAGLFAAIGSMAGLSHTTSLAIALILSGIITVVVLFYLGLIHTRAFELIRMKWKPLMLGIVGAFAGVYTLNIICEAMNLPDFTKTEVIKLAYNPIGAIAMVIVAPFVEEVVFREGIITHMLRRDFHRWEAIMVSSLAFSLVHFNPSQIPFAFAMGIIFAIIFIKTGNIYTTWFIHAVNNFMAVMDIRARGGISNGIRIAVEGDFFTYFYMFIGGSICVLSLWFFWNAYHRGHHSQSRPSSGPKRRISAMIDEINPLKDHTDYNNYNKYGRYRKW